jgi:xylulokinase
VNEFTLNEAHLARAAMEGVTLGIRYGLESMKREGIAPKEIRLTGGGSKSDVWRQIAAHIFDASTVTMENDEAACYGAALQAMWCHANYNGEKVSISHFTDSFVKLRENTRKEPDKEIVEKYDELYEVQTAVSVALRRGFELHRKMVSKV